MIRHRRAEDRPALEAIALRTHQLDGYPKYLPADVGAFIVDPGAIGAWVAVRGDQVVGEEVLGHVALHGNSVPPVMEVAQSATGLDADSIAVVARLLVAPAARRQGVGRTLLERATMEAARLGRRAVLDVLEEHRAAIALYETCGWKRLGRADWSLPGDLPLREFVYLSPDLSS